MGIYFNTNCVYLTTATGVCIYARRLKKAMLLHSVNVVLVVAIINLAICVDEVQYSPQNIESISSAIKVQHKISNILTHIDIGEIK